MEHSEPRVNGARLAQYIGRTVRLTAKVMKLRADSAIVETSDACEVEVKVKPDIVINETFVEIICKVLEGNKVDAFTVTNIGAELDMSLVNGTVEMMHAHPKIFMS